MAETSTIMGLVAAFIGIAIMLGVGIQILANVQTSTNCNSLPGFNASGLATKTFSTSPDSVLKNSGWSLSCVNNNTSIQNAYTLLIVIMIVIAAVAILFVVRML